MDILKVILTSFLSVTALFIIAKLMGHKQIAQLDFFDYISGITIGSIAAELATELEAPYRPLISLLIYGLVSLGLSMLTHKNAKMRKYVNGTPTILLSDGKLFRENLKKAKIDLSEFMLMCREQGHFDLEEIYLAVFEHNGKLSILPKAANRPLTPSDMSVEVSQTCIGVELVMDGRVMGENLTRIGRDGIWLDKRLGEQACKAAEVLLAIYHTESDKLTVYRNNG